MGAAAQAARAGQCSRPVLCTPFSLLFIWTRTTHMQTIIIALPSQLLHPSRPMRPNPFTPAGPWDSNGPSCAPPTSQPWWVHFQHDAHDTHQPPHNPHTTPTQPPHNPHTPHTPHTTSTQPPHNLHTTPVGLSPRLKTPTFIFLCHLVKIKFAPDCMHLRSIPVHYNVGRGRYLHERTQTESVVLFGKGRKPEVRNTRCLQLCSCAEKGRKPGSSVHS